MRPCQQAMNSYTSLACHTVRQSMLWTEGGHAKTVAGATNPVNVQHTMMNALHVVPEATGQNAAGRAGSKSSSAQGVAIRASLPHLNTDRMGSRGSNAQDVAIGASLLHPSTDRRDNRPPEANINSGESPTSMS